MRGFFLAFAIWFTCGAVLTSARAEDYPNRPVQVVVPYAPGGGTDRSTRLLAKYLAPILGQDVVVRNVLGNGGGNGIRAVLQGRPDGYMLGIAAQGPMAMLPHVSDVGYHVADPVYLALLGRTLMMLAVRKDAPYQDLKSFLKFAKDNPGKVTVGNSGHGGAVELATQGFAFTVGVQLVPAPFAGSAASVQAASQGQIDAVIASPSELEEAIRNGSVTPLAVMEDQRLSTFPQVPTIREFGIDFAWSSWKGMIAPPGLPDFIRATLSKALEAVYHDQKFLQEMAALGEYPDFRPGIVFREMALHDSAIAERVIRSIGFHDEDKGRSPE